MRSDDLAARLRDVLTGAVPRTAPPKPPAKPKDRERIARALDGDDSEIVDATSLQVDALVHLLKQAMHRR